MKVLVCDDQDDILELMTFMLADQDLQILTCNDGFCVMKEIEKFSPDLIVMDYWLNGIKADEIIKEIKTKNKLKDIPIILMSAISDTEIETVAKEMGIKDFVKKPFEVSYLKEKIKSYQK